MFSSHYLNTQLTNAERRTMCAEGFASAAAREQQRLA